MRSRDQKAVVTKAIRRYTREGTLVKKIAVQEYTVIITPNSNMLILTVKNSSGIYSDRVSIPRFSDYIVKLGTFSPFMESFHGTKSTGS